MPQLLDPPRPPPSPDTPLLPPTPPPPSPYHARACPSSLTSPLASLSLDRLMGSPYRRLNTAALPSKLGATKDRRADREGGNGGGEGGV